MDHWVAFLLLVIIGINMLKEALEKKCCECENHTDDFAFKTMLVMAIATTVMTGPLLTLFSPRKAPGQLSAEQASAKAALEK